MRSVCNTAASPPTGLLCNVSAFPPPSWGFPSPLWGGVRGGGNPDDRGLGGPPSLTLPHEGEGDSHNRGGNPRIAALRQALAKLETAASGTKTQHLALGVPDMHAHLPGNSPDRGLACGVLHEVAAAAHGDRPAAFGFLFALTAAALAARPGAALFIASRRALAGLRQPLRPRPRPARPRRRPAAPDRDPLRQGCALGDRGRAAIRGPARHGRRRDCRRPRSHLQPPAEPRRRPARQRRSSSCAPPTPRARAPRPRAGASQRPPPPATASAPSPAPAGAWRWSAAATAVPDNGSSSGTMSRIVSVWLRVVADRAPVARAGLRRAG